MAASKWRYTVVLTGTLEAEDEDEARDVAYEEAVEAGDVLDIEVESVRKPVRSVEASDDA